MYLWENDVNPGYEPEEKVIKALIYGVKLSGNQGELGIWKTGQLMLDDYPRQNKIIKQDSYVDDCMSCKDTIDLVGETTNSLILVLNKSRVGLNGFTFLVLNHLDL